ncbi:MAG: YciI family protein [Labedaea sp.]
MRYLTLVKGSEHAGPPPQALIEAIGRLGAEAAEAGVLVETGGLGPSALGARIEITGTSTNVVDGPFSETKELIGGYAVYEVDSKAEVLAWSSRFADLHTKHWPGWAGEVEIREVVFRQ